MRSARAAIAVLAVGATVVAGTMATPVSASTRPSPAASRLVAPPSTAGVPVTQRIDVLGQAFATSRDVAWRLLPSQDGLVVASGAISQGASLVPVSTLSVAHLDTSRWIGSACVMRGSHVLAVAFSPTEAVNYEGSFDAGGYAALVNLDSGNATYVPSVRPTLAYFSPSCGADGSAVFTSYGAGQSTTRLVTVSQRGAIAGDVTVPGELTSATTTVRGQVVAAHGSHVVTVHPQGVMSTLRSAAGQIAHLTALRDGRLAYTHDSGSRTVVNVGTDSDDHAVGAADLGGIALSVAAPDTLIVQSRTFAPFGPLPSGVRPADVDPSASASPAGTVFVTNGKPAADGTTTMTVASGRGPTADVISPSPRTATPSLVPARAVGAAPQVVSSTTTDNLPCAISRNDPAIMAYQPSVLQAEWAVDQAVAGRLTTTHAANYRGFGLAAYSPQALFPPPVLKGGGSVPPQILLGILANESNLWQASSHAARGAYGNPLTGDIYGRDNSWTINPAQSDCGYGIAQVTDGMRTGQMSTLKQRAVAQDYETNIAAGLQILGSKWNQLHGYTPAISVNDDDPQWIENWYFALWAYNSGLQPDANNGNTTGCTPGPTCADANGYWGLGWANNPANPVYPSGRHLFNSQGSDAMTPGNWPYQERVIGWAAYPFPDSKGSYSPATWQAAVDKTAAVAPPQLLCTAANNCQWKPDFGWGGCSRVDLHCWTHYAVSWKSSCVQQCGAGKADFAAGVAAPADPSSPDPAACTRSGLPANAVIVDDRASGSPYAPGCLTATSGSFDFTFTADSHGNFPAHIDLHQINGGLNGHYWFTHTTQGADLTLVTGTWTFPSTVNGWGDVYVHVPALGATSLQAKYTVTDKTSGRATSRIINTAWGSNTWIRLGAMKLTPGSTVSQTSQAPHETGLRDIAYDAVAFAPRAKPQTRVVALGDSYSAGEGLDPYATNTDTPSSSCHRSPQAYSNLVRLPGHSSPLATDSTVDLTFIPCSGARTTQVSSAGVAKPGDEVPYDSYWGAAMYGNGEELEADQGFLGPDTDLVLLTIGGNDVRFSDVVFSCTVGSPTSNCSDPGQAMAHDPSDLRTYEPHVIGDLLGKHLAATYSAIHSAAPNARILVLGYPRLFPDRPTGACVFLTASVTQTDQVWLNSMGDLLDSTITSTIASLSSPTFSIAYVDPVSTFRGHDACALDKYVNGLTPPSSTGSGMDKIGRGSYHPTASGQQAYADLVSAYLAAH